MARKQVVVIAGPTGSGESTFTMEFLLAYKPIFTRAISATTRPPRGEEKNGEDYFFFTKEEFFEHVQNGDIPEYTYVRARDAHYGTYLPDLKKKIESGNVVIVNTDLTGARWYKEHYGATTVFIKPKSMFTLRDRLLHRDSNLSHEELITRLLHASQEILEAEQQYDYTVFTGEGEFSETVSRIEEILKLEGYAT